jgi:hypothetical protein
MDNLQPLPVLGGIASLTIPTEDALLSAKMNCSSLLFVKAMNRTVAYAENQCHLE